MHHGLPDQRQISTKLAACARGLLLAFLSGGSAIQNFVLFLYVVFVRFHTLIKSHRSQKEQPLQNQINAKFEKRINFEIFVEDPYDDCSRNLTRRTKNVRQTVNSFAKIIVSDFSRLHRQTISHSIIIRHGQLAERDACRNEIFTLGFTSEHYSEHGADCD